MLTVTQATSQARRHVDKAMPGAMAFVNSRLSHDMATDTPTVVTTITYPENHPGQEDLRAALNRLAGQMDTVQVESCRMRVTRAR